MSGKFSEELKLERAGEADLAEIVEVVNLAYRGNGSEAGWTTEGHLITGTRTTVEVLRRDLADNPKATLLVTRGRDGKVQGSVWLEPKDGSTWYLGMLNVRPTLQDSGLGRRVLEAAEREAKEHGAAKIRMSVVSVRDTLIAWYERRGYTRTGEVDRFPYGAEGMGTPLRDDLSFVILEKELV